ncbi:LuxR C-terminal-related transcriptional regulator [Streptomyces sp. NBC_01506]|uniref:helix-turn-helix transcriptional regulator n=1 Tax=Streptomyces sp. NBC_01506 TaxID=2903887 RepID=UPI00386828F7
MTAETNAHANVNPNANPRPNSKAAKKDADARAHIRADTGAVDIDSILPPESRALYARLVAGETVRSPDEPGMAPLLALGAVLAEPLGGHVPVSLDRLERRLRASVQGELARTAARLEEIPAVLGELRSHQPSMVESLRAGSQYIFGVRAANRQIGESAEEARELLAAQPGHRTRFVLTEAYNRDLAALSRGVRFRTLYHVSARTNPLVRERVAVMGPKGALFRTLARPFMRMLVFDRKVAFFSDHLDGRPDSAGAWMVRDPAVCAHLAEAFEKEWTLGQEWHTSERPAEVTAGSAVSTQLQRTILRALVAGQDQQQIATALGYSSRTINVHLTNLRTELGYATVYQLVHWWATSPEQDLD